MKFNSNHHCEHGCSSLNCGHLQSTSEIEDQVHHLIPASENESQQEQKALDSLKSLAEFELWLDAELLSLESRFNEYVTRNSKRRSFAR